MLLKPIITDRNTHHNNTKHNGNGAEIVWRNGLHGPVEVLQGVIVLLLVIPKNHSDLRRGLHVLGDKEDGEVGLVGVGFDGGLIVVQDIQKLIYFKHPINIFHFSLSIFFFIKRRSKPDLYPIIPIFLFFFLSRYFIA